MKYLAVEEDHTVYLEESEEAISYAIVNELPIKYYLIELDERGSPSLEHITEVIR